MERSSMYRVHCTRVVGDRYSNESREPRLDLTRRARALRANPKARIIVRARRISLRNMSKHLIETLKVRVCSIDAYGNAGTRGGGIRQRPTLSDSCTHSARQSVSPPHL